MKTSKIINIQRDECGYSIYWGRNTRLEKGSCRLSEVRKRRVMRVAYADALTILAAEKDAIDFPQAEKLRLWSNIQTATWYVGSTLKNVPKIIETAFNTFKDGL